MASYEEDAMKFLIGMIKANGWDLRYTPQSAPYAAVPGGFGNGEHGVKIHFVIRGGLIRVIGVIDDADKVGVRQPIVHVSIYKGIDTALSIIKNKLMPRYKEAWYKTQSKIAEQRQRNSED